MAINTQFPSWITEGRIAEAQLGQQLGRNILEGLRFQEQKRQYEEMKPLRDAQMELNRANTASQYIQNQQQLTALNRQNEANAAMTDALKLDSEITRMGDWTNPESEGKFLDFISKYPSVGDTVWAQGMRKRFSDAKLYQKEKDLLKQRGEQELQQIKTAAEAKTGYIQRGPYGTVFQGSPEQIKKMQEQFPEMFQNQAVSPATTISEDPLTGERRATYRFPKGTSIEAINAFLGQESTSLGGMQVPAPGAPTNQLPGVDQSGAFKVGGYTIKAK